MITKLSLYFEILAVASHRDGPNGIVALRSARGKVALPPCVVLRAVETGRCFDVCVREDVSSSRLVARLKGGHSLDEALLEPCFQPGDVHFDWCR